MITIEEFKKLNIRIARKGYNKEELLGKLVVVVENLEPAVIRGVESRGMILAAQDGETLAVLSPDRPVAPGSLVK